MNVLILCAGYGTRLSPLTDQIPKPLVPLGEQSILEHQIDLVKKEFPTAKIHLNTHHLAAEMDSFCADLPVDKIWHEPKILGTGGPLYRMWSNGEKDELLILNCDNYHDLPIADFVEEARSHSFALLCTANPTINTLEVKNGKVIGIKNTYHCGEADEFKTFSGISWYSPEVLAEINENESCIKSFWQRQAEAGNYPLAFSVSQDFTWIDIGTPAGYLDATMKYLGDQGQIVATSANIEGKVTNSVILANAVIPQECSLAQCIVMPGVEVPAGQFTKVIFGDGFTWEV